MNNYGDLVQLLREYSRRFGPMPVNYTVFDLETSGFSPTEDLILEVGYAVIRNCRVAAAGSCLLNWCLHPTVSPRWLATRLARTQSFMAERGDNFPFDLQLLATGAEPVATLQEYGGLLSDAISRGELLVGHNSWDYDRRMLDAIGHRYLGSKIAWTPNAIFDTGLTAKAAQVGVHGNVWDGDTLTDFYHRTRRLFSPQKWSLAFCLDVFGLSRHYRLDMTQAHRAHFDCIAVHYLFEFWRSLLYG